MSRGVRSMDPVPTPAWPDLGPLMLGPLSALRLWTDLGRSAASMAPATLVIAMAPFFWAPPLWVGLLMAGHTETPRQR